ncbi:hypothetical protein MMC25_007531 [Agyrium rufum]|nr:hypothetical protein [Agyrium rufum]
MSSSKKPAERSQPNSSNPLLTRVTELERSTEPHGSQLRKALSIVGLDISSFGPNYTEDEDKEEKERGFGPREEWALRWLLKRMAEGEDADVGINVCAISKAWIFLRVLVERLMTNVSARHLNTYKFPAILRKTMEWLATTTQQIYSDDDNDILVRDSPVKSRVSVDALIDLPRAKTPRKRKRVRGIVYQAPSDLRGNSRLLQCITSFLQTLMNRSQVDAMTNEDHAAAYLRTSFKCPPHDAARFLECTFMSMDIIFTKGSSAENIDSSYLSSLIKALQIMWSESAKLKEVTDTQAVQLLFSKHCFPHCGSLYKTNDVSTLVMGAAALDIKRMAIDNTISHLRNLVKRLLNSETEVERTTSKKTIDDLMQSLDLFVAGRTVSLHSFETIEELFSLSCQLLPLDSAKRRIKEAPWLRWLFDHVVNCTFETSPDSQRPEFDSMFLSLLKTASNANLSLHSRSVERIFRSRLEKFEGLDQSSKNAVWRLIGSCIKSAGEIILPKSEKKAGEFPELTSNGDLLHLVKHLSEEQHPEIEPFPVLPKEKSRQECAEAVAKFVILPMVGVFIKSRNLDSFLSTWQECLVYAHTSCAIPIGSPLPSIWVHESILEEVARNVTHGLTYRQILNRLDRAEQHLRKPLDYSLQARAQEQMHCVILDTLVNGVTDSDTLTDLRDIYRLIFFAIGRRIQTVLPNDPLTWRLWRILSTIVQRLALVGATVQDLPQFEDLVQAASKLGGAALILGQIDETTSGHFATQTHALAFNLISSLRTDQRSQDTILRLTSTLVRSILNHVATTRAAGNIPTDHYDIEHPLVHQRAGEYKTSSPDDRLRLRTTDLLMTPQFSRLLDHSSQHACAICRELFYLAGWSSFRCEKISKRSLQGEYIDTWTSMMNGPLIWENAKAARNIVHITAAPCIILGRRHAEVGANLRTPSDLNRELFKHNLVLAAVTIMMLPDEIFTLMDVAELAKAMIDNLNGRFEMLLGSFTTNTCVEVLMRCMKSKKFSPKDIPFPQFVELLKNCSYEYDSPLQLERVTDRRFEECCNVYASMIRREALAPGRASLMFKPDWDSLTQEMIAYIGDERPVLCRGPARTLRLALLRLLDKAPFVMQVPFPSDFKRLMDKMILGTWRQVSHAIKFHDINGAELVPELRFLLECGNISRLPDGCINPRDLLMDLAQCKHFFAEILAELISVLALQILAQVEYPDEADEPMDQFKMLSTKYGQRESNRFFMAKFKTMELAKQVQTISRLLQPDGLVSQRRARLVHFRLILQRSLSDSSEMRDLLVLTFSMFCDELPEIENPVLAVLIMQCLDLLLRKHASVIIQYHVDNLLATIAVMTSISAPKGLSSYAGNVYESLCRLFMSILLSHRRKLGGRYHLVIPALQGLLRCLFIRFPQSTNATGAVALPQPRWIRQASQRLNATHATHLTRILNTICNPSPSVVARRPKAGDPDSVLTQQPLNDETKKAKAIAGQHLQYVVMEFCVSQLYGRLEPGMRQALNPGLWVIMDAMNQDIMRTVNSAFLDAGERAIWKSLYEDWRRFGRWKGS